MTRLLCLLSAGACLFAQAPAPPAGLPEGRKLGNGLYAVFSTSVGNITARLYEKEVPTTVENFVGLAQGVKPWKDPKNGAMVKRPLYDNITFHRILKGVMIQSGDPTGTGTHNCGINVPDEFLPGLTFAVGGQLAMANTGAPDSGGCQFFLTEGTKTEWNNHYTIFGTVVDGRELIAKIDHAPARGDKPIEPVKLNTVTISRVGPDPKAKKPKK